MVTERGFPDDEPKTTPNAAGDPTEAMLLRVHSDCCPLDRRKLAKLVDAWYAMPLEGRVLIEMLAFYLAKSTRGA
jgi:hypothetical protein